MRRPNKQHPTSYCFGTALFVRLGLHSLLLFTLATQYLASAEQILHTRIDDRFIRQQQPLRILVETMHAAPALAFPLQLKMSLFFDGQAFHEESISIPHWAMLSQGIVMHPSIPRTTQAVNLRCLVTLHNQRGDEIARSDEMRPTTRVLRKRFNSLVKKVQATTDPLAHLRLEQCALLLQQKLSIAGLIQVDAYLKDMEEPHAKQLHTDPALIEGAYQARSDASWQPYRFHALADDDTKALVLICHEQPPQITKAQWPALNPRIIQAAQAQGFSCLEIYPAGDQQWMGISLERIELSLAAVLKERPALNGKAICLLGVGLGCHGALRAAMAKPQRYAAVLLSDCPDWQRQQGLRAYWDQWLRQDAFQALGEHQVGLCTTAPNLVKALSAQRAIEQRGLLTRLDLGSLAASTAWQWLQAASHSAVPSQRAAYQEAHFSDRPFLCIVGEGEHLEAKQQIQDLSRSLQGAWAQHSHGQLPMHHAQDTRWDAHTNHNLIFIGNPFDNSCLHDFLKAKARHIDPMLHWDERTLTSPSGNSLRSNITALQWLISLDDCHYWVINGPQLRFPVGLRPLQNAPSHILLRGGKTLWQSE